MFCHFVNPGDVLDTVNENTLKDSVCFVKLINIK